MIDTSPIDLQRIKANDVIWKSLTHILIHHSATVDGRAFSWPVIKKYHMDKGWEDIGYNLGAELVGDTVQVLYGRRLTIPGAHCWQDGMNRKSVAICIVGNYDAVKPSAEHWTQALRLTQTVMKFFNIPIENVQGHREYAPKTCPGTMFDMEKFRSDLKTAVIVIAGSMRNVLKGTLELAGGLWDVEVKIRRHVDS